MYAAPEMFLAASAAVAAVAAAAAAAAAVAAAAAPAAACALGGCSSETNRPVKQPAGTASCKP